MAKLSFRLVMPERELVNTEADMVVVPGVEGDFGVMHGHAPLISIVRPGVLEVLQGSKVEQRFMVVGGFAEVTPERCTVLANEVLAPTELSREEGERRVAEAEAHYATIEASDVEGEELALERIQSARALVEAADALLTGGR